MIGTTIDQRYKVEELLGEGGFGIVYQCLDHMERRVALKMLRQGRRDERMLKKFVSEGKKLAAVSHPNVVQVYDSGVHDDQPYIVMEQLRGSSLRQLLEQGSLSARRAVEIMADVAQGLNAIHSRGLVHRDLSTNNVMVTEDGLTKILDLGLAKAIGGDISASTESFQGGTPYYMSPEQLEGRPITYSSDTFAFGVILYEALSHEYPFGGEHPKAILYGIAHKDPTPLVDRLPTCPPSLSALVGSCLEKRPEDRPQDLAQVGASLRDLATTGVLEGMEPSTTVEMSFGRPRRTSRNPYLNRAMIRRRGDFFGRRQELQRIYSRLDATPPGSVSVVGERKIGKSSLLNYVYHPANRQAYLERPDQMIMVFLDFQQEQSMSLETFVRTLIGMAEMELRSRADLTDCPPTLDGIEQMIKQLDQAGFRLAVLMDEFETITRNSNFDLEFFSFLRYLANHYNVAYLTSSARELQVLCHTQEIADSPFFNIFSTMRLGVFRDAEARQLISEPSQRVGKPLSDYTEQILEMAGLFPLFLQIACSHAIEHLDDLEESARPDLRLIRRLFEEEALQHFNYIWDGLDELERKAIVRVAEGKKLPDSLVHVAAELARKNYVDDSGEMPRLFSGVFTEFARAQGAKTKKSFLRRLLGGSSG